MNSARLPANSMTEVELCSISRTTEVKDQIEQRAVRRVEDVPDVVSELQSAPTVPI